MATVPVMLYTGGYVVLGHETVDYSTFAAMMIRVPRSVSLSELIGIVYGKLKIDSRKFLLKLSTKYAYMEMSQKVEVHLSLEDDDSLRSMLDYTNLQCLHLYVECEPIQFNVEVDETETYVPAITQGFNMIGLGDDVGTSTTAPNAYAFQDYACWEHGTGDWDRYTMGPVNEDVIQWPSRDCNVEGSDYLGRNVAQVDLLRDEGASGSGIPNTAPLTLGIRTHDLLGDSYRDETKSDSAPDTSSSEPEDVNCDDEDERCANIDENMNIHSREGTSSRTPCCTVAPSNVPTFPQGMYEFPPFFSVVEEEQIPDSVSVPSGSRTSYYNPDRGELGINMVFKDKKDLIASVKDFSVRVARREYHVVQSSPTFWKVRCKNSSLNMNCRWGLRACLKTRLGFWKITKYGGPHNCISSHVGLDHHNLDKNMVASSLVGIVRCDPSYEIKYVKQLIKDRYGYDISYGKAWLSLKRAVENVYGTWESSVHLLPRYLGAIMKHNPGMVVEWRHMPTNNPTVKVLNYVFWAYRQCIDGFNHCRKIISVDGTHLYTKYKHKMLIAVSLDGNNQILPLAFAIVDDENYDSWKWFLENISRHVVRGVRGVCLISDRHRGIISAVEDILDFKPPRGVHRFCLRHVCSNFNTQFKNVHLKDLCWHAGTQHQICKFDATMEAIKNKQPLAHRYLSGIPREKWTLAHDGGWRRGIMTTNMSECLNGVLKGARRLPISAIVQLTFQRCVQYFMERVSKIERMIQNNQPWPDYAYQKYEQCCARSSTHTVTRFDIREKSASVITGPRPTGGQHVQVVKLDTLECSCGKWTIFGIPCSHAICTAKWFRLDPTTLVQPWFSMHEYVNTYEGRFQPIADERYWDTPSFELHHNPVRRERRRRGRDRRTRIRNEMDRPTTRERQQGARDSVP